MKIGFNREETFQKCQKIRNSFSKSKERGHVDNMKLGMKRGERMPRRILNQHQTVAIMKTRMPVMFCCRFAEVLTQAPVGPRTLQTN